MTNFKLSHIKAIITGASSGLGLEIARAFVQNGASIAIGSRNEEKLVAVQRELESYKVYPEQTIVYRVLDVSDESSCKSFVAFARDHLKELNCLVNNAGILGEMSRLDADVDFNNWEATLKTNLYGALYMISHVVPLFKQNKYGKIINISGGGATNPMPGLSAYAASKAALVRLSETVALELGPFGIDVNAVAPGAMNTKFLEQLLQDGKDVVDNVYYQKALDQKNDGGVHPSIGAELCVYLASEQSDGIRGKLISAVWDNWQELHKHLEALKSDIFTLRRIIPSDRNQDF
jgi:NAD(P)-dependent dehydrogenase (short-subunit alcohol dehydrogenase family)